MKKIVKKKKLVYGIMTILTLAVLFLFIWNRYQIPGKCFINNCHGLEITCGPDNHIFCTMLYQAGDRCRQYASCEVSDGSCHPVLSQKFNDCKACVEKCYADFEDDQIKFFECESNCAK